MTFSPSGDPKKGAEGIAHMCGVRMFSATVGRCERCLLWKNLCGQVNAEDCLPELISAFNEVTRYIRNVVRANA